MKNIRALVESITSSFVQRAANTDAAGEHCFHFVPSLFVPRLSLLALLAGWNGAVWWDS